MTDQNETERRRRERANLANAFTRRAWTPSEKPNVPVRLLAGGIALAVVAAGVFGIGALISFQRDNEKKQRTPSAMQSAVSISASPSPSVTSPSPSKTPAKTSPARPPVQTVTSTPRTRGAAKSSSRLPTGPTFNTVTRVLIRNVMTGLCVDIDGLDNGVENGPVQQYHCDKSTSNNQLWDLVVNQKGAGPDGADLFTIRNSKDGLCLDLPGSGPVASRTDVKEGRCNPGGGDNQMWFLDKKGANRFWVRSHSSPKLCLDVAEKAGGGGPKAKLTVYGCDPKDDHLWSFS